MPGRGKQLRRGDMGVAGARGHRHSRGRQEGEQVAGNKVGECRHHEGGKWQRGQVPGDAGTGVEAGNR